MKDREDLRVVKTREAIRDAFQTMICEMDYDQITVKELARRARINRKTFYSHYTGLDDLLQQLQQPGIDFQGLTGMLIDIIKIMQRFTVFIQISVMRIRQLMPSRQFLFYDFRCLLQCLFIRHRQLQRGVQRQNHVALAVSHDIKIFCESFFFFVFIFVAPAASKTEA